MERLAIINDATQPVEDKEEGDEDVELLLSEVARDLLIGDELAATRSVSMTVEFTEPQALPPRID